MATWIDRRQVLAGLLGAVKGRRAAAAPSPVPGRDRIEVAGPSLRWRGRPLRLVGVAVGDPIYIRGGRPLSDYVTIAEDWRANCVRISLHPGHWRQDRGRAIAALLGDVTAARAAGLFVILCWHAIGFPQRFTERPDPAWGLPRDAYESDAALATDFWREMARLFGDDPQVLFELWNEPVVDDRLWRATGQHWPLLKALWSELTAIVRARSDNVVVAAGGMWAHDLVGVAADPLADPRTVYAWHVYPPADRTVPGRWTSSLDGLAATHPVIVTEWGFCQGCGPHIAGSEADFGTPFTRDLDRLGLSSTAWCWAGGAAPAMLEKDWTTPTAYGRFVGDYLRKAGAGERR